MKYTVPEGEGGHYTIEADYIDSYFGSVTLYICNEEQYTALCNKIKSKGYPVYASRPDECLARNTNYTKYYLEAGYDYYFIAAGNENEDDEYNLMRTRDIDVTLDGSGAASTGTPALYSKGSRWSYSDSRDNYYGETTVIRPEKSGFRFEGYYTAAEGQGTQVIDDQGEILPEMQELTENCTVYAHWTPFSQVSWQEINLEGRRFTMVVSGGERPYYQAFKFTVPEGGGSYSFYQTDIEDGIDASGYLCTPEQFERLCYKIEQNKQSIFDGGYSECLEYDYHTFRISYNLKAGKEYYLISARTADEEGQYKIVFERDITVTLAASDADQPGTTAIYSKEGYWVGADRWHNTSRQIDRPQKEGYKFAGYFTGANGEGIKVIDFDGEILEAMAELNEDKTVYAHWENFSPVEVEDIVLSDGRYSVTAYADKAPYYKVLRFKVPENGDGYYTFYNGMYDGVSMSGYWCNANQYERLCRALESDGYAQRYSPSEDYYVSYSSILNICNWMESGQEYYFVATRDFKTETGQYQLLFRRDIDVQLDAGEADDRGSTALYSSGDRWSEDEDRGWDIYRISTPQREGYLFAGYFTGKDGRGMKVIDQDGYIYEEEMHEFKDNTTVYAFWEGTNPEFKTGHLTTGIKGVSYKQQLVIGSKMTFQWWVSEGKLPAGLYLDSFDGCIVGRPTEAGTKTVVITARNLQITLSKEFTITINEPRQSGSGGSDSGSSGESAGRWAVDARKTADGSVESGYETG